jgi:hypothetical protein
VRFANLSNATQRQTQTGVITAGEITAKLKAFSGSDIERLPNGLEFQATTLGDLRRFAHAGYLYAILDSCDAPAIPEKARELRDADAVSLFKGSAEEQYWAVAPYLFKVVPATLEWIVASVWNDAWGIFVIAKAELETLRSHFRRFLMVQLPDAQTTFFRYYDPRVTPLYLSHSSAEEVEIFFGPVRAYGVRNAETGELSLLSYKPAAGVERDSRRAGGQTSPLWTVSPAAIEALSRSRYEDFERRMIVRLQETYGANDRDASQENLRRFVRHGVSRAGKYGIASELHIARYLDLMVVWGHDFDSDPNIAWASTLLQDPNASAEEKLDRITERTQFGPW